MTVQNASRTVSTFQPCTETDASNAGVRRMVRSGILVRVMLTPDSVHVSRTWRGCNVIAVEKDFLDWIGGIYLDAQVNFISDYFYLDISTLILQNLATLIFVQLSYLFK